MGELLLLGLGIYWLATDTKTALWVIGGGFALIFIAALLDGKKGNGKSSSGVSGRPRIRIDHPHVIDADDYECGICGRRFSGDRMTCPYCGVRFTGRKENYEEFDWEEDELEAWDEEEGW